MADVRSLIEAALASGHGRPRSEVRERPCPGCGRRTRDREERCGSCRRALAGFRLHALDVEQLLRLKGAVQAEIERRKRVLDGEEPLHGRTA